MASTLITELKNAIVDARDVNATWISFPPAKVIELVHALENRDGTIQQQDDRHRALKAKLTMIMNNDTATVPTKMQLIRRVLGIPEPR